MIQSVTRQRLAFGGLLFGSGSSYRVARPRLMPPRERSGPGFRLLRRRGGPPSSPLETREVIGPLPGSIKLENVCGQDERSAQGRRRGAWPRHEAPRPRGGEAVKILP
jgi:hypothetical protein